MLALHSLLSYAFPLVACPLAVLAALRDVVITKKDTPPSFRRRRNTTFSHIPRSNRCGGCQPGQPETQPREKCHGPGRWPPHRNVPPTSSGGRGQDLVQGGSKGSPVGISLGHVSPQRTHARFAGAGWQVARAMCRRLDPRFQNADEELRQLGHAFEGVGSTENLI